MIAGAQQFLVLLAGIVAGIICIRLCLWLAARFKAPRWSLALIGLGLAIGAERFCFHFVGDLVRYVVAPLLGIQGGGPSAFIAVMSFSMAFGPGLFVGGVLATSWASRPRAIA